MTMTATATATEPAVTEARIPVVYRPRSAVFWLYIIAVTVSCFLLLKTTGVAVGMTLDAQLALAPVWIAFMVFLVWLMFKFDPYRSVRRYPQALLAGTALGGTTALVMAMYGNSALGQVWGRYLSPETLAAWEPALTAPFVEEAAKAVCAALILVLCSAVFTRISHALLVGMFVGAGFDVVEDLTYTVREAINNLDSDLLGAGPNLLQRILTAIPAHWSYTALASVGVLLLLPSYAGPWRWPRRLLTAVALLGAASFMHFVWDSPSGEDSGLPVLARFGINFAVFLIPVFLLLRVERGWVAQRIADARADGSLSMVSPEVLDSLTGGRSRRRLRRQARRDGGRAAKKAVRQQQREALDRIQG